LSSSAFFKKRTKTILFAIWERPKKY